MDTVPLSCFSLSQQNVRKVLYYVNLSVLKYQRKRCAVYTVCRKMRYTHSTDIGCWYKELEKEQPTHCPSHFLTGKSPAKLIQILDRK